MAQQRMKMKDVASRQEGSRWIGDRPTGEELAKWFRENVRLGDGMKHEDWIGGITLISATETVLALHDGEFVDMVRLVHVPYARVDARISYFWELCELNGWLGEIEPVSVPRLSAEGYFNLHLPAGFGILPVPRVVDGKPMVSRYLTCSQRVSMYLPDVRAASGKGRPLRIPAAGTKQVPMLNRWGHADDNLIMKAETGAQGRALGMAGIFVLPGSGVATAEDMTEFLAEGGGGGLAPAEPELPANAGVESQEAESIDARIASLIKALDSERPADYAEFEAWAAEKDINLGDLRDSQKRSVLRKLESYVGVHTKTEADAG